MADVDSGDILRLGALMKYDTLYDVVNVYHVLTAFDGGKTWAQVEVFVQTYMNNMYTLIEAILSDKMSDDSISVANLTQNTTLGSIAWDPHWVGDKTGDSLPAGVCLFVWARTYKPRVQIRKYISVLVEADCTDGTWITVDRDAVEDLMEYHIAQQVVSGDNFMQGIAYNRTLETYEFGRSVATAAEVAYQRRRKRGAGS